MLGRLQYVGALSGRHFITPPVYWGQHMVKFRGKGFTALPGRYGRDYREW